MGNDELYNEQRIEIMERDIELLKETIDNLNFIISTLKESNKNFTMEMMSLDLELNEKNQVMELFLKNNNLSIEDVLEFENELRTTNSHIFNQNKKS